jgi:hypothetical protein
MLLRNGLASTAALNQAIHAQQQCNSESQCLYRHPELLVPVALQPEFSQARMVIWPDPRAVPVEQPLRLFNGDIIDRCMAVCHVTIGVELPVLVAMRPEPLTCKQAPLLTHGLCCT